MRGGAGRRGMEILVVGLVVVGLVAWFISEKGVRLTPPAPARPSVTHAPRHGAVRHRPTAAPGERSPRSDVAGGTADGRAGAGSSISAVAGGILHDIRRVLQIVIALFAALTASRLIARSRRRCVRLWLLPFRADDAEPDEVRRLLESWHQQLLQRWYRRLALGQPSLALEIVMAPDAEGDRAARLSIVCPEQMVHGIEGALLGCYPDTRLLRGGQALPPTRRIIRLKKRQTFVWALRTPTRDDDRNVMDALLTQMSSVPDTAVVQYALTPTPALFDRYSRGRFSSIERRAESSRRFDPANPGLRSEVFGAELQGGLRVQHRPLFFTDIRVTATTLQGCRLIAGALRGASGAENRLVERTLRRWGRGGTYLRRVHGGVANPIPDCSRGVLSSTELSALWQLPTPGLKVVRVARSPLPRILAPPEVSREPDLALARDEHGFVGIRAQDKSDGLGLIGGQKTGKTSLLCRTIHADALDPQCAMVVLMPKSGDAVKALSTIPADRTVHFLDLEKPELGFNPLIGEGDPAMIADRVVEAFRDVHAEGDIRGSSDRYLRQAAQAAVGASRAGVVDGPPTLWHMYRLLLPGETSFRDRVVEALYAEPRFADTATFFGRELPGDLEAAPSQTSAKLDAPRNKLLRLMVESLDKVLRHPVQLSLDDLVRRREVLIVDGKMGTFGSDNCRVMMQFLLIGLYGALQRQQQLPEAERARVAVKVDEAHLILNESFADAMATLRSGGLEMVAAWQYGDQIQDEKVRGGMMSLLRQRCMFSMGESSDARELSQIAMASYTDVIRNDSQSRARLRVTPDTIFNLPNHYAVCSWISRGARAPAFIAQTLPLQTDEAVIEHHLAAQRERGAHVPNRLPDPLPDLDWDSLRTVGGAELATIAATAAQELTAPLAPATSPPTGERAGSANADGESRGDPVSARATGSESSAVVALPQAAPPPDAPSPVKPPMRPTPPRESDIDEAAGVQPVELPSVPSPSPAGPRTAPETYAELDLDDVRGIIWEKVGPPRSSRSVEPTPRDLEILGALWSYRLLFANQIWRRWWSGSSSRAAQQGLKRMAEAGWVKRFRFQLGERGAQQRVYCLTREGFELARGRQGRHGLLVGEEDVWREPQITDPRRVLRDLHVNGWVLALETVAGRSMGYWRGPRQSRLEPPRRKVRGEWVEVRPSEIVLGSNHRLQGSRSDRLEPVTPDAIVELRVGGGEHRRFDVMVELDRARSTATSEERLHRYDLFVSGWGRLMRRYRTIGSPPLVVFVCEDEHKLLRLIRTADGALSTRVAKAGTPEEEWPYPGRHGIVFALERDIHEGSLRAIALPEHPPELRVRLDGPSGRVCQPRRVDIVDPRRLRGG